MSSTISQSRSTTFRIGSNKEENLTKIVQKQLVIGNKRFSLLEKDLLGTDGLDWDLAQEAISEVANIGGLHGEPRSIEVLHKNGGNGSLGLSYWDSNEVENERLAKMNCYAGGGMMPNLDCFMETLVKSTDPGDISPVIIVHPDLKIKEFGHNKPNYPRERINNNPYEGLKDFVGKEYDGSLNIPELEQFKGLTFGNTDNQIWAYTYSINHLGNSLGITGFSDKLFELSQLYKTDTSEWRIIGINHKKFDDSSREKTESLREPLFRQNIEYTVMHSSFKAPLSPRQFNQKIVEEDRLFWNKIASQYGYEVEEIEPSYTDKSPLTPGYKLTDKERKPVIAQTRWRVWDIGREDNSAGKHIGIGRDKELHQYMRRLSQH
jgi:hypothetical protein